ncbi:MAG: HD domain-containing protein [Candidatus Cloacimonetes bacterium]|nr:HD domain-containing protein [Candidatus Cloacimonadota bacterium]
MNIFQLIHRMGQFKNALFAKVNNEEISEISQYLDADEISLFLSMSIIDQRHSLDVFNTSKTIIHDYPDANVALTFKAVLLHDVGKSKFDLSLLDRILATLPKKLVKRAFFWKYQHVMDYKYLHPSLSAEMVSNEAIKPWVKVHYDVVHAEDPPELKVLKISDSLN